MSDSSIAIVSGGGTLVDTRTNAGGDHRQVIIIGDQTANDAIAVVTSADSGVATSEYGMVVRPLNTDAAKLRISAVMDSGSISAKSGDAGQVRVSASIFPDTTGGLTAFMSLSVSAAQSVKGSAGSLYGYYAFNKDTKINFLKLYNLSAGLTLGTDVPVLTIPLPISGGANAWFGNGIAGFTAGIQMAATSGLAVDNTALPAASAITVDLFYK